MVERVKKFKYTSIKPSFCSKFDRIFSNIMAIRKSLQSMSVYVYKIQVQIVTASMLLYNYITRKS
jgi:hypothetical protein